jgi:protein-S-isoprenylcysteine O-methyltransferase Ste14
MEVFLKLIICWTMYFVIHSVFASHYVKRSFKKHLPGLNNYYRIIYNLFSILGMLIIFIFQSTLPQRYLYTPDTGLTFLGISLASLGLILIRESFAQYDVEEFLGTSQLKGDLTEQEFIRNGILRYIRHPLYSASMLIILGYLIFAPSNINLISGVCMILYLIIGSNFEEKKLARSFGKDYLTYKKEVPAFIPSILPFWQSLKKAKK